MVGPVPCSGPLTVNLEGEFCTKGTGLPALRKPGKPLEQGPNPISYLFRDSFQPEIREGEKRERILALFF